MFKFLGNLFKKIGEIFVSLAKGAEKVWEKTEPEIQDAMLKASGIVDTINKYIDETPDFIFEILKNKFPEFSEEKIKEIIDEVHKDLNLAKDGVTTDLNQTIQNIADYIKQHTGSKWAKISEEIANGIALFLAPAGTAWNKIGTIMWWVYQTFIKKDK